MPLSAESSAELRARAQPPGVLCLGIVPPVRLLECDGTFGALPGNAGGPGNSPSAAGIQLYEPAEAMDEDLIQLAKTGDGEAVGRLYERHASRVYAIVRRLSGDDAQAEDLAQETWLRVFKALPDFRGDSRFTTWIHRIAVNVALYGQRRGKRRREVVQIVPEVPDAIVPTDKPLLRLELERAIDRLPEGMRRVLVLHDVEGYKHEEIAEMLGIATGTCKSQLFKARAKLRETLRPEPVQIEGGDAWST
jgi:RNA polymerase sigma-70 factor, ECF subfamily